MKKYVIISPVRNEEEYILKTLKSVLSQTIQPTEWIIVNDGSTDNTLNIINENIREYDWVKVISRKPGAHSPGGGVVRAFYAGFNEIKTTDFDFIIKLDGDLSFEASYFENLINEFANDPKLGIASGKTYIPKNEKYIYEACPHDHTRGPAKMYSKKCFDDIGGLPEVLGWDTLDDLKSQLLGYHTKSFWKYILVHYKPIGYKQKKVLKKEFIAGERQHYLGYHWLFAMLKSLKQLLEKPFLIKGLLTFWGFFWASISSKEQISDKAIIKHLRKKQLKRIFNLNK